MAQKPNGILVALGIGPKQDKGMAPSSFSDKLSAGYPSSSQPVPNYGSGTTSGRNPQSSPIQSGVQQRVQQDGMNQQPQQDGQKVSPEEAGFIPMEKSCGDCNHYDNTQGLCSKVDGPKRCCDTCLKYFEPANASGGEMEEEPDADDLAGSIQQPSGQGGY